MVVINSHRTTAIVIKNDGCSVTLVPMSAGKLSAQTLSFQVFRQEWTEASAALDQALDVFRHHAEERGATSEVNRGLARLAERDRIVPSLF